MNFGLYSYYRIRAPNKNGGIKIGIRKLLMVFYSLKKL